MATAEPCNCDETQQLRAEVARLNAIIDSGRRLLTLPAMTAALPSRCGAYGSYTRSIISCELPAGHGGEHRCGQIVWPQ